MGGEVVKRVLANHQAALWKRASERSIKAEDGKTWHYLFVGDVNPYVQKEGGIGLIQELGPKVVKALYDLWKRTEPTYKVELLEDEGVQLRFRANST